MNKAFKILLFFVFAVCVSFLVSLIFDLIIGGSPIDYAANLKSSARLGLVMVLIMYINNKFDNKPKY